MFGDYSLTMLKYDQIFSRKVFYMSLVSSHRIIIRHRVRKHSSTRIVMCGRDQSKSTMSAGGLRKIRTLPESNNPCSHLVALSVQNVFDYRAYELHDALPKPNQFSLRIIFITLMHTSPSLSATAEKKP
jgi:hypothetical protein